MCADQHYCASWTGARRLFGFAHTLRAGIVTQVTLRRLARRRRCALNID